MNYEIFSYKIKATIHFLYEKESIMKLLKNKTDEFYSPWPIIIYLLLCFSLAGTLLFFILYAKLQIDWIESIAITFFTTTYHIGIRLLSPVILSLIFHKKYDYHHKWFQPKKYEQRLYKILNVKKWKNKVMVYDPSEFSLKVHSVDQIINNMCHAEVVHELIMLCSMLSIFFSIPFGALPVFVITTICATLFDSIFVIIQRYNRPRVIRIYESQNRHKK